MSDVALSDLHGAWQVGPGGGVVKVSGKSVDGKAGTGTVGGDTIAGLIEEALADKNVKALVVRVDSPGGSVMASERIRLALMEARRRNLPVVASMGSDRKSTRLNSSH